MTDREVMQMALEALEALQGGCTDHDDGTVEAITVWCPEVIDALRAQLEHPTYCTSPPQRFAGLVAAAEREECAKVCEALAEKHGFEGAYATECATAIRARETHDTPT